jgi:hypothetical protein
MSPGTLYGNRGEGLNEKPNEINHLNAPESPVCRLGLAAAALGLAPIWHAPGTYVLQQ